MNVHLRRNSLLLGAAATLVALIAMVTKSPAAPSAWLFAWFFCLGLPLGAMVVLWLHGLTGGHWGQPLRPILTAATRTFPWFILLAVPILLSLDQLYPWLGDGSKSAAAWYLNRYFFLARLAVYLGLWWFFSYVTPAAGTRTAAAAMVVHALLLTFAAVDLIMSLQPGWYSTTFGLLIATAQILSALALCAVALRWLSPKGEAQDFHDLGNLLLAFVMIWAYIAFTQFLIIWYENIPREIAWYLPRFSGPWAVIAVALVIFHFALPFVLLLVRRTKRHLPRLASVALVLLLARIADSYWIVVPNVRATPSWLDAVALIAVGGLWFAAFLFHLERIEETAHG